MKLLTEEEVFEAILAALRSIPDSFEEENPTTFSTLSTEQLKVVEAFTVYINRRIGENYEAP